MSASDCIRVCRHCGERFTRAGKGHPTQYCNLACKAAANAERYRLYDQTKRKPRSYANRVRPKKEIICAFCFHSVLRQVRQSKDASKFCSRECAFSASANIADERNALKRIKERARQIAMKRLRLTVKPEVEALRRIATSVRSRLKPCRVCSATFLATRKWQHFCSTECRNVLRNAARRIQKARRRARERSAEADRIDPLKVFERDRWICHICKTKTLPRLRGKHDDKSPELDHIISLADGGSHTWGNVACACRKCNIGKGARSSGQLGLGFAA